MDVCVCLCIHLNGFLMKMDMAFVVKGLLHNEMQKFTRKKKRSKSYINYCWHSIFVPFCRIFPSSFFYLSKNTITSINISILYIFVSDNKAFCHTATKKKNVHGLPFESKELKKKININPSLIVLHLMRFNWKVAGLATMINLIFTSSHFNLHPYDRQIRGIVTEK